jgi:hypothetical protein
LEVVGKKNGGKKEKREKVRFFSSFSSLSLSLSLFKIRNFEIRKKNKMSLTVDWIHRRLRLQADLDSVEGVPDERDGDAAYS